MGGLISQLANQAFRDFQTDGMPSSGPWDPNKSDIRNTFNQIDLAFTYTATFAAAGVMYATVAAMNADLAHGAGTPALVYNDPNHAANGVYVKVGASGSGNWQATGIGFPPAISVQPTSLWGTDGNSAFQNFSYAGQSNKLIGVNTGGALAFFPPVPPALGQIQTVPLAFWTTDANGNFQNFSYAGITSKVIGTDAQGRLTFYNPPPIMNSVPRSLWGTDQFSQFSNFAYGRYPSSVIGTDKSGNLTTYPAPTPYVPPAWVAQVVPSPRALLGFDISSRSQNFTYGNQPNKLIGTDSQGALTFYSPAQDWPPTTPVTAGGIVVESYAEIRSSNFQSEYGEPIAITLADQHKGGIFIPGAPGQLDNGGTCIVDQAGNPWVRVYSGPINAGWFYDNPVPGSYLGDGVATGITAADQTANPQWIGLPTALGGGNYPVGTTWSSVALLQAIYACFASASTPGNVVWNSSSSQRNFSLWLPPGNMPINQPFYVSARGVDITFAAKAVSNLLWKGANNVSPVMFDAISYGAVHNLSVSDQVGVTGVPLVDLNWTGANPGLKTQQLSFYDMLIFGNGTADSVGFYVSRHGGDAQGDTIALITPSIFGCFTGMVAGGANALNITVIGGNIQNNYKNGAVAYGGSIMIYSMSMEVAAVDFHNYPQAGAIALDGADLYAYGGGGATSRCVLRDYRSENIVLCYDRNHAARLDNVGTAQAYTLYGWGAGAHAQLGMLIATGGLINKVAMMVDDSGPAWFAADAASTNTRIIKQGPSPNWSPNQWAGFTRWFRYGNSFSFAGGPITTNDANSVTDPNGWYSPEPYPGFVPGQLANYLVKVCGIAGNTPPAWDTFPVGLTMSQPPGTPQYGLTTSPGSNVVSSNTAGIVNGMFMVVCDAIRVQAPPAGGLCSGPLIGKVQNVTPGASFTASLTAGVMNVTAMTTGTIKIGAAMFTLNAGWPGTVITGQLDGTTGGVGHYSVSNPQQPDVASKAVTTSPAWELVNSLGEPQLATQTIVDGNGYWGTGIPDGQLTWLPIDFDVMSGVASGDGIDPGSYGKFRDCGYINFAWAMDTTVLSRFRALTNGGPFPNFSYRNGGPPAQAALVNNFTTTANASIPASMVARGSHANVGNALAAFTLNMPLYLDNVTQEFKLYITNQNAAAVLTWGTNVKTVNPTIALGAAGHLTIITLTWIGSPAGAGSWYVGGVQGPY